jgi:hypothetical protein
MNILESTCCKDTMVLLHSMGWGKLSHAFTAQEIDIPDISRKDCPEI